ncbi:D-alanyl-D-alanine carboxypeptidase [Variovorax sp. TBS-050B]|nr:D-alanyl-D-alanine carboxypeptidase [Variovorax sp. TBS-050B]
MARRWLYPLKGELSAWSTECNSGTPSWVSQLTKSLAREFASPANQVVFVTAAGESHGCVSGWADTPFMSKKIDENTRFRLASVSKAVSFIGLVHHDKKWLDRRLVDVLGLQGPFSDPRVKDIRIRNLLDHSAGFDRKFTEDAMVIRDRQPWCPYIPSKLTSVRLDFAPGARFAYANIGHCLAGSAFEGYFGMTVWEVLENDLHLFSYGVNYLEKVDSPVRFNFMNEGFYDENFVRYFDWHALRGSMGLTGNARGLAQFIWNNRSDLRFARQLHIQADPRCEAGLAEGCYDGFLERRNLKDGAVIWNQKGYLYGMSSMLVADEKDNILVWLGSGSSIDGGGAYDLVQDSFARASK